MNATVDEQIGELAAHVHAATARLADLAVGFDSDSAWSAIGMRSCAHWLSVNTGIDLWTAREMLRAGHALRELTLIHDAFAAGRLSFDKARAHTRRHRDRRVDLARRGAAGVGSTAVAHLPSVPSLNCDR